MKSNTVFKSSCNSEIVIGTEPYVLTPIVVGVDGHEAFLTITEARQLVSQLGIAITTAEYFEKEAQSLHGLTN